MCIRDRSSTEQDTGSETEQDINPFEEITEKAYAQLPPEVKKSIDLTQLRTTVKNAKSFAVLLTGKSGSGKSTLTNGILGTNVAKEGDDLKRCTTEVKEFTFRKGEVDVKVWDSPGLQDGTVHQADYLMQMKDKCTNRDLTMYCLRITDGRFVRGDDNPDVLAMKKLTATFGTEFWANTIIVLTFSNTLEAFHVEWEDLPRQEKAAEFKKFLDKWRDAIREILIEDIEVSKEIVDNMRIVPAGHYKKPHLPGNKFWLSTLWFQCLGSITSEEGKLALWKMNASRLKGENAVTGYDFKKEAEEQPLVVTETNYAGVLVRGAVTTTAAGSGATFGAALGSVAGPVGTVTGALIGGLFGFVVGVTVSIF